MQKLGLQFAGEADFGGVEGNFTAGRYVAHLRFPQLNATYQMTVAAMQAMVDGIGRLVLLGRDSPLFPEEPTLLRRRDSRKTDAAMVIGE